jgi:hypothetical protein
MGAIDDASRSATDLAENLHAVALEFLREIDGIPLPDPCSPP